MAFVLGAVAAFVSIRHGCDVQCSALHASHRAAAHFSCVTGDCLMSTGGCGCRACWSVLSCYATALVRAQGRGGAPDIRHRTLVGADRKRATMHGAHWVICGAGGGIRGPQRAISMATTNAQLGLCSYRWTKCRCKVGAAEMSAAITVAHRSKAAEGSAQPVLMTGGEVGRSCNRSWEAGTPT